MFLTKILNKKYAKKSNTEKIKFIHKKCSNNNDTELKQLLGNEYYLNTELYTVLSSVDLKCKIRQHMLVANNRIKNSNFILPDGRHITQKLKYTSIDLLYFHHQWRSNYYWSDDESKKEYILSGMIHNIMQRAIIPNLSNLVTFNNNTFNIIFNSLNTCCKIMFISEYCKIISNAEMFIPIINIAKSVVECYENEDVKLKVETLLTIANNVPIKMIFYKELFELGNILQHNDFKIFDSKHSTNISLITLLKRLIIVFDINAIDEMHQLVIDIINTIENSDTIVEVMKETFHLVKTLRTNNWNHLEDFNIVKEKVSCETKMYILADYIFFGYIYCCHDYKKQIVIKDSDISLIFKFFDTDIHMDIDKYKIYFASNLDCSEQETSYDIDNELDPDRKIKEKIKKKIQLYNKNIDFCLYYLISSCKPQYYDHIIKRFRCIDNRDFNMCLKYLIKFDINLRKNLINNNIKFVENNNNAIII